MREGGRVWVGVCDCVGVGGVHMCVACVGHDPFNVYVLCTVHPSRACNILYTQVVLSSQRCLTLDTHVIRVYWSTPLTRTHVHTHTPSTHLPPPSPSSLVPRCVAVLRRTGVSGWVHQRPSDYVGRRYEKLYCSGNVQTRCL